MHFVIQSVLMESNWAAEHLQVIRTLMERSAIYRRALAPIMLLLGLLGLLAAIIGSVSEIEAAFPWYWLAVGVVGVSSAYMLVRRQAFQASEPFWSPPTRRVTQAVLPSLFAGVVATILLLVAAETRPLAARWLPALWIVLYGCAVHAAGFFMPRGMKLFGWGFLIGGAAVGVLTAVRAPAPGELHWVMGLFFGGFHLAYGIYLYFTERGNEA